MSKEYDPEDPLELVGMELPAGDPSQALEAIVQEYLLMGWKPHQILFMFRTPYYGALHQIYQLLGHDHVKQKVLSLAQQWKGGWLIGGDPNA